ncbi:MAG: TonB-dependent receptor [Flavobacteriaceae bacterium]|nr:TonB-dependent receptor [Flavobacteriaceae bacterium]
MKILFTIFSLLILTFHSYSQEKQKDSSKVVKLDEVLVKAVRVNATSPITHSNIYKRELKKRNLGQDIPILMNYLPNVVTTSDAGAGIGYTGIRVRGSDADRVNVTINGIPYNDAESQGTFWVNMPDFASSTENLQLQRGVGTSTNGSGAFGASLNVLTDAVSQEPMGEISNSFGSFNTRKHNIKFSTGLLNDKVEIAGRLSKIASDGYIDRASSDLKSYFLQTTFLDRNTLLKALVFGGHEITYQSWFGIDGETLINNRTFNPAGSYTDENGNEKFYDKEEDNYKQDHYQLHWNERFNSHWSTNIGLNYTYGRGYFEQYKEDENFTDYNFTPINIDGENITTTDLIRRRWLDNDFYVINANANYKNNKFDLILGGSYNFYDGDHYGEIIWTQYNKGSEIRDRYYEGNGKKTELSVFSKATLKVNDKLSLYGDLQGRFINYQSSGLTSDRIPLIVDKNYNFFNPKAGVTYKLNSTDHFYISYARANREPRRSDFENGITKAEKLNDYELGWRHDTKKFVLNSNFYYMHYKDQLVLTGEIDDVGAPIRTTSGKSYRVGLELESSIQLSDKLIVRPNLAISSNRNQDFIASRDGELVNLNNTKISFSPKIVAGNSINYRPSDNFQFAILSKYVGEQYMGNVDSDFSKLDSYFINDLNIVYEINTKKIFKSIVLSALVNNFFNVKYVSNGYYYTFDDTWTSPGNTTTIEGTGYYPQATTNFLIGATLKF